MRGSYRLSCGTGIAVIESAEARAYAIGTAAAPITRRRCHRLRSAHRRRVALCLPAFGHAPKVQARERRASHNARDQLQRQRLRHIHHATKIRRQVLIGRTTNAPPPRLCAQHAVGGIETTANRVVGAESETTPPTAPVRSVAVHRFLHTIRGSYQTATGASRTTDLPTQQTQQPNVTSN